MVCKRVSHGRSKPRAKPQELRAELRLRSLRGNWVTPRVGGGVLRRDSQVWGIARA